MAGLPGSAPGAGDRIDILDRIVTARRARLEAAQRLLPPAELREKAEASPPPRFDLLAALKKPRARGLHVIAEVKKASPSKGIIRADFRPLEIARAYQAAGATALSVLTEEDHFQGKDEYLRDIAAAVPLPVLRKDFIVDEYQIHEARLLGASAFLLIVACLEPERLATLIREGERLGLTPLIEVHEAAEVKTALEAGARLLGINNRNLRTFETRLETTFDLLGLVPPHIPVISESGIFTVTDMQRLREGGARAALIGESLMREKDEGEKLRELLDF